MEPANGSKDGACGGGRVWSGAGGRGGPPEPPKTGKAGALYEITPRVTADYDDRFGADSGLSATDTFVKAVYTSLKNPPKATSGN